MSVNLILSIRDARGLSASEKSVLYSLAARCKAGVVKCYPSVPLLAGDAGLHERTVQRVLQDLSKKRWITIILKKVGASNINSRSDYILHPPLTPTRRERVIDESEIQDLDGGATSPPGGDIPPSGGAMPPEVSIEVTKEVTKTKLSTGEEPPRQKNKEIVDAENLIQWFKNIGVAEVELQALKRDKLTGRGISGQSINISSANACSNAGQDIFIRPIRGIDHPVIMLDDLDAVTVNNISSRWRSAVIETSAENHQIWVATSRPLTESQRKVVQQMLIKTFGGDEGSTSGEHWGRAPGYANRKLGRNDYVAGLISASGKGKLLDVDSVLDQAQGMLQRSNVNIANTHQSHYKQPTSIRSGASGDDSADEFGWTCGAIRSGMSLADVESQLTARARERRGADAPRYAKRTVAAAMASI